MEMGFCLTLFLSDGDKFGGKDGKDFCEKQKNKNANLKFSELVPYTYYIKTESFVGKREAPYLSKVLVIIDSGCA